MRLADSRAARNACTSRATTLGATYRIERTTLKAGYGHQRLDGSTSRFASLGVDHALSPRTTLNASLGYRRDARAGARPWTWGYRKGSEKSKATGHQCRRAGVAALQPTAQRCARR